MTTPILATKLHVPPLRPDLVPRRRLVERLNQGLQRRLTLLSAPAGFGKTTLLAEWAGECGRPVAWFSLDAQDNDPVRFLSYLVAAMQQVDPSIGGAVQPLLQVPSPRPEPVLSGLINASAISSEPFVLVLDDYQCLHAMAVHDQLGFIVTHQPAQLHIVIATREDPPLPLARLRAAGQMDEIRQADLRFNLVEAAELLARTAEVDLTPADVAALQQRTEGWAAGLQLAALSLRQRENHRQLIASFTGSHRYVLDYLVDEVFQRQPPEIQAFLLQTSILERFTAALCDAVTGRQDSHTVLLDLERANMFLVPLDGSRHWYRYHHLFADLLRHRLETDRKRGVRHLHRRASRWHAENGTPQEAIHHALAAGDWQQAAELVTAVSDAMLRRGEVVTLIGWFQALPEQAVRADPRLCFAYSWPLILASRIEEAEVYLRYAEQAQGELRAPPGEIAAARAYIARARGDHQRVVELSQQALALLPQDNYSARSVVAVNLGIAHWYLGNAPAATRALAEAAHAAEASDNAYARHVAELFQIRIDVMHGHSRRAIAAYDRLIRRGGELPAAGLAHLDLARLLYERNELQAAADHLARGVQLGRLSGNFEFEGAAYWTVAALRLAQGELDAAEGALQEAQRMAQHPGVSPSGRIHCLAAAVLIALAAGDHDRAKQVASGFPEPGWDEIVPDQLLLMLARARLLLAQGQRSAATEVLAARYELASLHGWRAVIIETRALQALAAPTAVIALDFLAEALALAQPEGYVRTFVDLGEPMETLLEAARAAGIAPAYVAQLLDAFTPRRGPHRSPGQLVEPLSERELDLLPLLTEGLTNQEIAQALHVSVNTIKTHLKHIYGKLGVTSRRQAARRARDLGLLR